MYDMQCVTCIFIVRCSQAESVGPNTCPPLGKLEPAETQTLDNPSVDVGMVSMLMVKWCVAVDGDVVLMLMVMVIVMVN